MTEITMFLCDRCGCVLESRYEGLRVDEWNFCRDCAPEIKKIVRGHTKEVISKVKVGIEEEALILH
jgi:hypothetical protein